ncbi:hypothetical protein KCU93_g5900, partial [Aureobasidium melanogenum]
GHSQLKTGHPVRSAIHKQLNGRLVLRWVTTWESLLLYVLVFFLSFFNSQLIGISFSMGNRFCFVMLEGYVQRSLSQSPFRFFSWQNLRLL